jgi:cytochrome c oxidase subunit 4
MSEANGHVDIDHHVKIYMIVFAALAVLTAVTVAVSYLHVSVMLAIGIALSIATIKGTLVACYFMHLISEKKLIYAVLAITVLFFFFALMIPMITETGNIHIGG